MSFKSDDIVLNYFVRWSDGVAEFHIEVPRDQAGNLERWNSGDPMPPFYTDTNGVAFSKAKVVGNFPFGPVVAKNPEDPIDTASPDQPGSIRFIENQTTSDPPQITGYRRFPAKTRGMLAMSATSRKELGYAGNNFDSIYGGILQRDFGRGHFPEMYTNEVGLEDITGTSATGESPENFGFIANKGHILRAAIYREYATTIQTAGAWPLFYVARVPTPPFGFVFYTASGWIDHVTELGEPDQPCQYQGTPGSGTPCLTTVLYFENSGLLFHVGASSDWQLVLRSYNPTLDHQVPTAYIFDQVVDSGTVDNVVDPYLLQGFPADIMVPNWIGSALWINLAKDGVFQPLPPINPSTWI